MKRAESITRTYCDVCGAGAWYVCMECGKDICRNHSNSYSHAVHFSGSYDGEFCSDCVVKLLTTPTPLFLAYRAIQQLRAEEKAFNDSLQERAEAAQAEVKKQHELYRQLHPKNEE